MSCAGRGISAEELVRMLDADIVLRAGELPAEVDVEVTGRCNVPRYPFAPSSMRARNADMPFETFAKIVDQLAEFDDVRMTLGGFGEPLLHPRLPEMLKYARRKGIFGIHVETDGILLKGALAEALLETPVDVVSISLEAFSEPVYRAKKGGGAFADVCANVEALIEARNKKGAFLPFIAVEITKTREHDDEVEKFYERWWNRADWVVIRGFNDFAGQVDDHSPLHITPGKRTVCEKLMNGLTVFADGSVPVCRQDFGCGESIGKIPADSIGALWTEGRLPELRAAHAIGDFSRFGLCRRCTEWCSP
jgi:spiro-SPASM protein